MQYAPQLTPQEFCAGGHLIQYVESGSGELLVLIHGSLCDYRYWRWQIPAFSGNHRVVAPSLPGCWPNAVAADRALASKDTRYSVESHAAAIIEFCLTVSPTAPVTLLGHSRGAQVALEAALLMPNRVRRLILADPGFPFAHEPPDQPVHARIASELGELPLDDVLASFVDAVNGAGTWRRTVSWFKDMVRDNAWTLVPQVRDIGRSIDANSLGTRLNCPILLISGELSPQRYNTRIQALRAVWPSAEHVVVPKAAHGMNLANAPYFNDAVARFIGEN